jgi:hypothetical protein
VPWVGPADLGGAIILLRSSPPVTHDSRRIIYPAHAANVRPGQAPQLPRSLQQASEDIESPMPEETQAAFQWPPDCLWPFTLAAVTVPSRLEGETVSDRIGILYKFVQSGARALRVQYVHIRSAALLWRDASGWKSSRLPELFDGRELGGWCMDDPEELQTFDRAIKRDGAATQVSHLQAGPAG